MYPITDYETDPVLTDLRNAQRRLEIQEHRLKDEVQARDRAVKLAQCSGFICVSIPKFTLHTLVANLTCVGLTKTTEELLGLGMAKAQDDLLKTQEKIYEIEYQALLRLTQNATTVEEARRHFDQIVESHSERVVREISERSREQIERFDARDHYDHVSPERAPRDIDGGRARTAIA